jgi:hypothetical protein
MYQISFGDNLGVVVQKRVYKFTLIDDNIIQSMRVTF